MLAPDMAYGMKDNRTPGAMNQDALQRHGASPWNSASNQYASGHDFAYHLLDSLKNEPALFPSYLTELSGNSWEKSSSLLADFAHLYAISSHGWPALATQVAANLKDQLESDLSPAQLAQSLFGDSITHADCIRQLAIAVGPTRLRAGLTTAEANALAHRRRIEILLESERTGCALGTGVAITLSWHRLTGQISQMLRAAPTSGQPAINIPGLDETPGLSNAPLSELARNLSVVAQSQAARRGLLFGVGQALALQATFWSMLADRARTLAKQTN